MRTSRGNIYHATVTETGHGLRAGERVAVYRDGMSWVVLADAGRVARLSTAEARGYLRTARIDGKPSNSAEPRWRHVPIGNVSRRSRRENGSAGTRHRKRRLRNCAIFINQNQGASTWHDADDRPESRP
jgi:hypothetical protein